MSLLGLFDIGRSAMLASQTALSITSHNIANVNTPGFSRQEVIFQITNPVAIKGGYAGRGVAIADIQRHYDRFIQAQLLGQHQNFGRSLSLNQTLNQIEMVFNEAKDMGLATSLKNYFSAWHEVAVNPEGQPQRTALLQRANALVQTAKGMESGMLDTVRHMNEELKTVVGRINTMASEIAVFNDKIMQIEAGLNTDKANDLRDQRQNLLNELSRLTEFSSYEDKNGSITVMVGMRNLVSGERTNTLSTEINDDRNRELYLDGINITENIRKGQLGGIISARNYTESNPLQKLRKLIASIIKEVNLLHRSGYGLDATTGNNFFAPLRVTAKDYASGADVTSTAITDLSQLTLDEYEIRFDAGNYNVYNRTTGAVAVSGAYNPGGTTLSFDGIEVVIEGAVTSNDRFVISPLTEAITNFGVAIANTQKIAASSSSAGLPANNLTATAIAGLTERQISNLGGAAFMSYYRDIVSDVGTMSRASSDSLKFDDNLLRELNNRRESVSGVSLDEEAANLIRFQRSFEAGARMIKVTDELLQTILNL